MTEIPLPESIVSGENPKKTGELTKQEKLEWSVTSRLVQLSFKRPDLQEPISGLLKLINAKVANKLENNKYKDREGKAFNLEKFEKSTAKRLTNFAVYANSGRFEGTKALELTQELLGKLDPKQAEAVKTLEGFIGDSDLFSGDSVDFE